MPIMQEHRPLDSFSKPIHHFSNPTIVHHAYNLPSPCFTQKINHLSTTHISSKSHPTNIQEFTALHNQANHIQYLHPSTTLSMLPHYYLCCSCITITTLTSLPISQILPSYILQHCNNPHPSPPFNPLAHASKD